MKSLLLSSLLALGACASASPGTARLYSHGGDLDVDASVNGRTIVCALDTGATRTTLTLQASDRLGLSITGSGGYISGVGGTTVALTARIPAFQVGGISVPGVWAEVVKLDNLGGVAECLLGRDVTAKAGMIIDLGANTLTAK